jgi:hypothetical protein
MKRMAYAALLASVVVALWGIHALAKDDPSGNWTVNMFDGGKQVSYWLVHLEEKGGKLEGTLETAKGVPPSTLKDIRAKDGLLEFAINVRSLTFDFQGKVPSAQAKKIHGSMARGGQMVPALLERTEAKDLKDSKTIKDIAPQLPKELDLKVLTDLGDSPLVFELAGAMFRKAAANKASPDQVRSWYELLAREAPAYGPRWQRETVIRAAEALAVQKPYASVAEQAARQALTGAKGDVQLRALTALVTALRHEGSPAYAKDAAALEKLERAAYHAHEKEAIPFTPEKFAGRKDKSERAVLVELFTGAMCPPCVAADLAFDGLAKAYSPREVVLLEYHLHIPGPDPLTNADTEARLKYYGNEVEGTPTIFFNGKSAAPGGGGKDDSREKFAEYCKVIDPLLEKPAPLKLQADAARSGDKIRITAAVSGLDKPGEKMRLRLALVEEWARYQGGNGLPYHHHVVRDMPGGPQGLALTKEADKQEVTVDLNQLRARLGNYLEEFTKNARPFNGSWPLTLYDLRVVAFVQNDDSKEVLQAVEVPIRGAGEK